MNCTLLNQHRVPSSLKKTELFCRWLLEEFHLNNTTVMLAPASGFYSVGTTINNQVRIAYVLEVKKLKLAIKVLHAFNISFASHSM